MLASFSSQHLESHLHDPGNPLYDSITKNDALGLATEMRQPKREADEYIRDNVWFGYTDDAYFDCTWDVIGEDKSMWGSDYPHPRNTFPNTQTILDRLFANVPEHVGAKSSGLNMAKLFNLDVPKEAMAAAE